MKECDVPRSPAAAAVRTAVVAVLAIALWPAAALCEVSVRGTAAAARIDARQAPLSEVLTTLGTSFQVRHDTLISLDDVIVSGTYSGTLEEVLRRVLNGLNYVIETREGTVEVIIVGRTGAVSATGNARPEPPPKNVNPAAQWRKTTLPER
jgi:hypothetical protein